MCLIVICRDGGQRPVGNGGMEYLRVTESELDNIVEVFQDVELSEFVKLIGIEKTTLWFIEPVYRTAFVGFTGTAEGWVLSTT